MAKEAKIDAILMGMEVQNDEVSAFINTKTCMVTWLENEYFDAVRDDAPMEAFEEWQIDEISVARDILNSGDYLPLPDSLDEWEVMEGFTMTLEDPDVQEELLGAANGPDSMKRFHNAAQKLGVYYEWRKYKESELREQAVLWCQENHIPFKEIRFEEE
jgi:hypothetical protein